MCFPSAKNETRSANIPIANSPEAKLHAPPGSAGYLIQKLMNEQAEKAAKKAVKAVMAGVIDAMWETGLIETGDDPASALQFPMDDLDL